MDYQRQVDALENIAAGLERLRLIAEHVYGVKVLSKRAKTRTWSVEKSSAATLESWGLGPKDKDPGLQMR